MTTASHLWAIGYDDMTRAGQVRDEIIQLGWGAGEGGRYLILDDIALVVRHPDGSFTFDRKRFSGLANILTCTGVGFLAGLYFRRRRELIGFARRLGRLFSCSGRFFVFLSPE